MSSGKVHNTTLVVLATGTIAAGWAYGLDPATYLLASAGILTGTLLTPDLDLEGGNRSDFILRGISPVVEWVWDIYWWPYRKIPHRSVVSHGPVFSTLLRVVYFPWIALTVLLLAGWPGLWLWLVGLIVADLSHLALDGFKIRMRV